MHEICLVRFAAVAALISAITAGIAAAADPAPSGPVIDEVAEAGIYCPGRDAEELGPKFFARVEQDCLGNSSCRVSPLDIATEAELVAAKCTRFFVQFSCLGGALTELESQSLKDVLTPSCM